MKRSKLYLFSLLTNMIMVLNDCGLTLSLFITLLGGIELLQVEVRWVG